MFTQVQEIVFKMFQIKEKFPHIKGVFMLAPANL